MNKLKPISVNGVHIYPFKSAKELLLFAMKEKKILVAVNAEKIIHATNETRNIINSNIGYADGIGAVLALKMKGIKGVVKIPGCELWLEIVEEFHKKNSFYLVGGKPEIIKKTVVKLKSNYPTIQILNYRDGYINSSKEQNILIEDIKSKKPTIVFVAMGSPKQEILMKKILEVHPALYQGLGGSFDVFTENVKRAPKWWVKNNLEWAFRLIKQPLRIGRQIHLCKFVVLLILKKI